MADVVAALEAAYPPRLAEDWDAVGLVCGDPDAPVAEVVVAVDPVPETVRETLDAGAQLLVTHHPLLLRGVHGVPADHPKGRMVHQLIQAGAGLFTAHTNADSADPGVSDALAAALDLTVTGPLQPRSAEPLDKIVVFVPVGDTTLKVLDAMADAGAGRIGDYSYCAWSVDGVGQFLPRSGASPAIGRVGELERVSESRLEMVLPRGRRGAVVRAMLGAHPYEEPAYDVIELAELPGSVGLGRIGTLAAAEPLAAFAQRVAAALPATVWGVRAAGDPDRPIRTVAVCGGAGDSALDAATSAGVDAYVTADLRHHPAAEHLLAGTVVGRTTPALVDVAHWASEHPWCEQAAEVIRAGLGGTVDVRVSQLRTDPWTISATSADAADIPGRTAQ